MSPKEEANWIVNYLSLALKQAGFGHIKILMGEENRDVYPERAELVFQNIKARQEIYGIALHWYFDQITSPIILNKMKEQFPDKQILYTEACNGFPPINGTIRG